MTRGFATASMPSSRRRAAVRWTTGELVLDPEFWEGFSGYVSLLVAPASATASAGGSLRPP